MAKKFDTEATFKNMIGIGADQQQEETKTSKTETGKKKNHPTANGEKITQKGFYITEKQHMALKIGAAKRGMEISEYMRKILDDALTDTLDNL